MPENGLRSVGCGRQIIAVAALGWLAVVPVLSRLAVEKLLGTAASSGTVDALSVLIAALALTGPFAGLAVRARDRANDRGLRSLATGLVIASGYVALSGAIGTAFPQREVLIPLPNRYEAAGAQAAALVPYAAFAAWLAPRLSGDPGRSVRAWLGAERFSWPALMTSVALASWVGLPWPLTGALGDGPTSLALAVQVLVEVIPQLLIFWGVVFGLLTSSFSRSWTAGAVTILTFALSVSGGFRSGGHWTVFSTSLFLLPMGLLLTEIRARGRSVLPLLPLALCYRGAPLLFVDPRDAVAQGIPELQHLLSYIAICLAATTVGAILFVGRRLAAKRPERGTPRWHARVLALVAAASWALWGGLYLYAGEPGFFNDGFLIILDKQADLDPAAAIADHQARRSYVYETLVAVAQRTQGPLRAELDRLGVSYRPYYIINMVRVDGHRRLMRRFDGRPGVGQVILNPNSRRYPLRIPMPNAGGDGLFEGLQENLAVIRADVAWSLGATGEGIVVGGQDTGYEWDHPALKAQYHCWDGEQVDHNYCWHDAWDNTLAPFDDGTHGTHTMGTVLGDDTGGNRTGVAPRAQWIGCRNMRRGLGNPGSYAECMEFLLAPYPLDGDPFVDGEVRLGADVTNNSWGCPSFEGCFPQTLRPAVEALRAAGIAMVVSAGNEGPACATATPAPANYDASFSVGATSNDGEVVGFSSRGPANGLLKPDIAAPGQLVRSSVPGGAYAYAGGTSMAGPHVAGTVALVWSVAPALVGDVDATEALLCETAAPRPVEIACAVSSAPVGPFASLTPLPACACGGVTGVPNNVYGCGLVDAGAAVNRPLESQR